MIPGTRVRTPEGFKGITMGQPVPGPAGWIVTVNYDVQGVVPGNQEDLLEHELEVLPSEILAKAVTFETAARRAGWSALARNGCSQGVTICTATSLRKTQIILIWEDGRFSYEKSSFSFEGGKPRKIRNVSEAKRLLGQY